MFYCCSHMLGIPGYLSPSPLKDRYLLLSELCGSNEQSAGWTPDSDLGTPFHACHPLSQDK